MGIQRELLHKYFRGETVPEEEKQIMDWAEASPENYTRYLDERRKWNALLIHYTDSSRQSQPESGKRTFNLWKVASIAAAVALLFSLSWILIGADEKEAGLQAVIVPAGQRVELLLEDGTKVWLNSKTSFTYPTSFGKTNREVVLDGEAYFEVARDTNKPFIVKTHKYDIKVLGTTFNVYAYNKEGSSFETALLEGAVNISSNNGKSQLIKLKPQETVTDHNGILQKGIINNADHFRWKDGLICVDDLPFNELVNKFAIYYDVTIQIENGKLSDYRCTGKFRQSDGVEYALRVIQRDLKFQYTRDENTNTIKIR